LRACLRACLCLDPRRPKVVDFADVLLLRDGDPAKGVAGQGVAAVAKMGATAVACGGHHTLVARGDRKVLQRGERVV
jgi:hypothetical protein